MEGNCDPMSIRFDNCLTEIERPCYCTGAGQKPRFSVTCTIFAGLIAAMVYIFALTGGSFKQLVIVQAAFVLWIVFSIAFSQKRIAFSAHSIFILLILAIVLTSNLTVNLANYGTADRSFAFSAVHVVGILAFAFAAQWAVSNLRPAFILESISWMLAPLIILALAMGWGYYAESTRAAPFGVHPNWWGEVAFGFILCSLASRRVIVKIFFIAVGIGLMIVVQSRGALLAAMVSLLAYFAMQYRPLGMVAVKKLAIFGVMILGGLVFIMMTDLKSVILDTIESKILLLNNPHRGLDSGLTGRFAGWREAAEIFIENPIFGQGFNTLVNVHNGFLRWAGEGGILLLGVMLLLVISALVRSWRRRNDWAFAVLLGIMAYMMTYPRALNLNLVGMVFFLALFPWKGVQIRSGNANLTEFPILQRSSSRK